MRIVHGMVATAGKENISVRILRRAKLVQGLNTQHPPPKAANLNFPRV